MRLLEGPDVRHELARHLGRLQIALALAPRWSATQGQEMGHAFGVGPRVSELEANGATGAGRRLAVEDRGPAPLGRRMKQ